MVAATNEYDHMIKTYVTRRIFAGLSDLENITMVSVNESVHADHTNSSSFVGLGQRIARSRTSRSFLPSRPKRVSQFNAHLRQQQDLYTFKHS